MSDYSSGSAATPGYPPVAQAESVVPEPSFEIKLGGQVIGTVYPRRLKGGAQLDLEDAQTTRQVIAWMQTYAGSNPKQIEALLRELPLSGVTDFVRSVAQALQRSIALGNTSGPR